MHANCKTNINDVDEGDDGGEDFGIKSTIDWKYITQIMNSSTMKQIEVRKW